MRDAKPAKSILKRKSPTPEESEEEEDVSDKVASDSAEDSDYPIAPVVSKSVKAKLEADDAEIAALEKKLGLKGKKSKKIGDAELDWLVNGSDSEEESSQPAGKRKRPDDDEWLRDKRRKASAVEAKGKPKAAEIVEGDDENEEGSSGEGEDEDDDDDEEDGIEDIANPFSEDEDFSDSDEDEDDDDDERPAPKKARENPYVAPVTTDAAPVAKYVPPSMRKAASSDEELLKQLRRQLQGQLNRLSEANLVSILHSVQEVYTNNARQHVTSVLVELLGGLVCDPSVLNDTFLILHAGFAAAVYRTVGTDFGAQLLENIVQAFDKHHAENTEGKQTLNLLAFLSNLYALQATGCEIVFDYIRMLLDNFSEANTELLLRVIRISGAQLRQDDPSALKDIVLLLQRSTSKIGEANLSVRTKFMIETIHNLKNNRMKTGVAASALSAEHMQRMKKTLGTLKAVKTTEPLRITLADIRDSEKKGKWWLVGASWRDPAKMASSDNTAESKSTPSTSHALPTDQDSDSDSPDLSALARSQGMNTDVRRAIFIAIAGAVDYRHAHLRIQKLNLKSKQQLEIPRVLLHCVGAEPVYNHFYTLVATQFCGEHRYWKAYQFALLDIFRRMGEVDAGGDGEEGTEGQEELSVRKIYNLAKMYATLIAEGLLRVTILKPLSGSLADLQPKTKIFVEVLLTTVLVLARKNAAGKVGKGKGKKEEKETFFEEEVRETFEQAHAIPEMVLGLKWFVSKVVSRAEVAANDKERKVVMLGSEVALRTLTEPPRKKIRQLEEDDGDSD
jgi:nucleolar MIF4G domain-containing protein 1